MVHPEGEKPTSVEPKKFKATKRRALNELPAPVGTMNAVACTLVYTLYGIGDYDIAEAMKITIDDVKKLKKHSAYTEAFSVMSGEFINANSDLLASRLAAHAGTAIDNVVALANGAKKENVKLSANQDILDRNGVTAKDNAAKGLMQKSELRIIHVDGEVEVSMTHTMMNGG